MTKGSMISKKDRNRLRELARRQMENAMKESNQKKIKLWYKHNDLQGERPMLHLELWTFAQEIIPPLQTCTDPWARAIEYQLYLNFLNQELFDDDKVTLPTYDISYDTWFCLFDIPVLQTFGTDGAGHQTLGQHFEPVIQDLEDDYFKLKESTFGANMEAAIRQKERLEEIFGDLLPVRLKMDALYSVPTQMLVHIMSMETMMYSLYDHPSLFKEMMERIAKDTLKYFDYLEEHHYILPTISGENLGQGTWCFNHTLPKGRPGQALKTTDVWGFMDAQETVGLSPDMFKEFIFPCYQKISERYGLLSYGCCEPVDPVWDSCISKLKNLRKVSISPWCNEEFMSERLKGLPVIYHRKPSPNFLGVGNILDEEGVRAHIRKSLKLARGCSMEITQRDVYTINHDLAKARRYVDIIKEEIENLW
ncbi:MAG: hypothetical protein KHX56_06045 [Clostridiales bacterium]|nr:hypothetical protein [Clostridiales bacterium]